MAIAESVFGDLPDEILQQIFYYFSPQETLLSLEFVSKRFAQLANEPLLWRYHCRTSYRYWDSQHRIKQKFLGNVADVDWKRLFRHRLRVDAQTTRSLDGILAKQTDRIVKYESIAENGYDVKDALLRHCRADDSAPDVLARRYYGTAVLDHIHRAKALEEWARTAKGESVSLERALGAFDMFVLHDEHGDMIEISDLLDAYAAALRFQTPGLDDMSPRDRARAVVQFLRANSLTGLSNDEHYRDLQNNYIGIALQDPDHPSLPLISVAIFCALSQRFGLDAQCCGFPSHVHAVVYPPKGMTMDGQASRIDREPMYLDPWRHDSEVSVDDLKTQLIAYGIGAAEFDKFLGSTGISSMILRTSRNILATVHAFRGLESMTGHPTIRLHANPFADMDNAFYSALWANFLLFNPSINGDPIDEIRFTPMILERFERLYPMDAKLIERYVCRASRPAVVADQWEILETLRVVRAGDTMPKQLHRRNDSVTKDKVKHHVGQVFKHRRYHYTAVITGWDVECTMNSEWMQHNRIDTLSNGRHQSFYHALVDDSSIRYVAEENVEIIEPELPGSLMGLAGRYFKRWDSDRHRFVSNVRDEYPDD